MTGNTPYLSILTLNVKVSILKSKDKGWRVGLKSKTQPLVACKKCISLLKTYSGLDERIEKDFPSI
jgi:hypothetical protein